MTKLFAGSLIKVMHFTHQQIFGILIYFPHNGVHSKITALMLLSGRAKLCWWWHVLRDMLQWHVPLTWPQRTSPICWEKLTCGAASPHPWCGSFPRSIVPPNTVVHCSAVTDKGRTGFSGQHRQQNRDLQLHSASSPLTTSLVIQLAGCTSFGQRGRGLKAY